MPKQNKTPSLFCFTAFYLSAGCNVCGYSCHWWYVPMDTFHAETLLGKFCTYRKRFYFSKLTMETRTTATETLLSRIQQKAKCAPVENTPYLHSLLQTRDAKKTDTGLSLCTGSASLLVPRVGQGEVQTGSMRTWRSLILPLPLLVMYNIHFTDKQRT